MLMERFGSPWRGFFPPWREVWMLMERDLDPHIGVFPPMERFVSHGGFCVPTERFLSHGRWDGEGGAG